MGEQTTPRRIAVVGSGVAGLTAAYVASRTAHVTLFEADDRLGGHADTHRVTERRPDGTAHELAIDTGFIVHNPRTYPVLLRMFAELGVATQPSEMSMSIRDDATGLEWAGALGRRGLFPTSANLRRPRYLAMLAEIPRFHRRARAVLGANDDERTLGEFLADGGFSAYFVRHFMEPLVASVWSCDPDVALAYPARYLFTFLQHHGMLGIFGSPQWRTVTGGSHEYVRRIGALVPDVRLGHKVTSVLETPTGVEITDGNGQVETFDAVVIAAHPAEAVSMLADPTEPQRAVLGALPYAPNTALLHTDTSLLPAAANARASWNFRRPLAGADGDDRHGVVVTYDLTRLQRLDTDVRYLVTLGGEHLVDPARVIARREYAHPLYTPASVAARARLPEIDTERIVFAGAYHGWGFHEDGARSGLAAVTRLGLTWPEQSHPTPDARNATGVYATTITHTRRTPVRHRFSLTSHTWVVDVDDLPDRGVLGRFEARDHLGDPAAGIRDNVAGFLAEQGITGLEGGAGTILLAAHPRALGYCFNPISVFWCWDAAGAPIATVVEVHNTYGGRHAYLVHPDEHGRVEIDKRLYVSPFHGTDGRYTLVVPPPDGRLRVAVDLRTDDGARFSATLSGKMMGESRWARVVAAPAALRGALLIRAHGIWLWLRRLPVQPRPREDEE